MYKTSSNFSVSYFRHSGLAWMVLTVFCVSFVPSISVAQQPTTIVGEVNIEDIQRLLQELGYNPGPIDGIMGNKTADAIKAFQTDMNVPVDGQPSASLLELLQREIARHTGPTAVIADLNGDVLVSGQPAGVGTVLIAGDTIQTQAGANVVLELSDGSQLELGENTKADIAVLSQTTTGARVSRVKMLWGWIRAKLSSEHQQAGSSFDIETPNAIVGVKFSQPDVEVSYDPARAETIGIAHTVELMAKNLLTDEELLVPVGSTVIIVGTTIKIIAGIMAIVGTSEAGTAGAGAAETATTGTETVGTTAGTESAGMGTGTKVAIGAGAAAAAGGIVALVAISGDEKGSASDRGIDWDNPFTGTFVTEPFGASDDKGTWINKLTANITQNGTSVTGTMMFVATGELWPEGSSECTRSFAGTAEGTSVALFSQPGGIACEHPWTETVGTANCTLVNEGMILRCTLVGQPELDFFRQ